MDLGIISLAISAIVATLNIIVFRSSKEREKQLDISKELEIIKNDIVTIKLENIYCSSDRKHNDEDIREVVRLLEKLNDKMEQL